MCGRRHLFCGKIVTLFLTLAAFVEALNIFFFVIKVAEIFQGTTLQSPSCPLGRGSLFGTSAEGLLPSVTEQRIYQLCQLRTYLGQILLLPSGQIMADPKKPLLSWLCWCLRVTLHGDEVPVSHSQVFKQSVSSRKLEENTGSCLIFTSLKLELSVWELPAGWVLFGWTGQSCLANQRGVILAMAIKASYLPCTWGSSVAPGWAAQQVAAQVWEPLSCYFAMLLLFFPPKWVLFPILSIESELCRVAEP